MPEQEMGQAGQHRLVRIQEGIREIILIPTAHVSPQSVELVRRVIEEERPGSVCIELDEKRFHNIQNPKEWENTDIVGVIKSKRVGFLLVNLALSSYQKKLARQLDTPVGGEMLQGIESAREVGAQLVLADRDIQTTFLRIWRKLGMWEKAKMMAGLLLTSGDDTEITEEMLQSMLQQDMLESLVADMKTEFPVIGEVLVAERDRVLAENIRRAPGDKVVAVLGAAHVAGVEQALRGPAQSIGAYTKAPPKKKTSKLVGWIIPVLMLCLFAYGFLHGVESGLRQLSVWVVWNGGLAALFVALALGHPLSIITAFLAAPITSMNPLLACGWFAGLVEATLRKPTVKDLQEVGEDIFRLKSFYRNRLLRVILVVIMGNVGSSIGTVVAGLDIVKNLF